MRVLLLTKFIGNIFFFEVFNLCSSLEFAFLNIVLGTINVTSISSKNIFTKFAFIYSQTSMARTPLGPRELVQDRDSSSQ